MVGFDAGRLVEVALLHTSLLHFAILKCDKRGGKSARFVWLVVQAVNGYCDTVFRRPPTDTIVTGPWLQRYVGSERPSFTARRASFGIHHQGKQPSRKPAPLVTSPEHLAPFDVQCGDVIRTPLGLFATVVGAR